MPVECVNISAQIKLGRLKMQSAYKGKMRSVIVNIWPYRRGQFLNRISRLAHDCPADHKKMSPSVRSSNTWNNLHWWFSQPLITVARTGRYIYIWSILQYIWDRYHLRFWISLFSDMALLFPGSKGCIKVKWCNILNLIGYFSSSSLCLYSFIQ